MTTSTNRRVPPRVTVSKKSHASSGSACERRKLAQVAEARLGAFYRLLELGADHDPVRYHDLIIRQRSKAPPAPPGTRGHPPSLERPVANRPWRAAEMQLRLPYSG
jgi:hypothetical protein